MILRTYKILLKNAIKLFYTKKSKIIIDTMNYENTARVINDDIFDLINQCFDEERSSRNNESRLNITLF